MIGLAGNKLDLSASKRAVPYEEAKGYADENGCIFFETSAKTGENVIAMFQAIAHKLPKNAAPPAPDSIHIISQDDSKSSGGCCK